MEVGGKVVPVTVPLGIYATQAAYFSALQEAGRDQHPVALKCFGVKFDPAKPFVSQSAGANWLEKYLFDIACLLSLRARGKAISVDVSTVHVYRTKSPQTQHVGFGDRGEVESSWNSLSQLETQMYR